MWIATRMGLAVGSVASICRTTKGTEERHAAVRNFKLMLMPLIRCRDLVRPYITPLGRNPAQCPVFGSYLICQYQGPPSFILTSRFFQ